MLATITDQLDHVRGGQNNEKALEDLRNLGYPIKKGVIVDPNDRFHLTPARCLSARAIDPAAPDIIYCTPDR